jgi:branched-chain amino acid aminotransferase
MSNVFTWKIDPASRSFELFPLPEPTNSLDGASNQLPDGAYTTFRTYDRYFVPRLEDHFTRLMESAGLTNHAVSIDEKLVRVALHHIIALSSAPELRIRMSLDLSVQPGEIYVSLEGLKVPSETDYKAGVKAVTVAMQRMNPKAKLTGFIHLASEIRAALPPEVNEALMLDEGTRILEGLSSNFFAVKGGEIWTAEEGVLSGITRCVVLDVANRACIPVHREPIKQNEISSIEEAFITSTSRAVLPVVAIDGQSIGNGEPGRITKILLEKFKTEIRSELEQL